MLFLYFYHPFCLILLCFFTYNLIIMNFNNSKLTPEEQKKIRSTNLYNVLGEIKKEFSVVENENDFTTNGKDIEDYVKFHIAKLEKSMYLHVDGLTELFRRMSKQTRTECCPLMIESSSTIYIDLDYYIINNENNQDMVEKFNKDIAKGIINDFKSIVPEDNNPVYILTFPSMINFDDKSNYPELMNTVIDRTALMRDVFKRYL